MKLSQLSHITTNSEPVTDGLLRVSSRLGEGEKFWLSPRGAEM